MVTHGKTRVAPQEGGMHSRFLPDLCTSTTDPSLFSFHLVKQLNKEHIAKAPLNPFSAVSVAKNQQLQREREQSRQAVPSLRFPQEVRHLQNPPTPSTSAPTPQLVPDTASSSNPPVPSSSSRLFEETPVQQLRRSSAHEISLSEHVPIAGPSTSAGRRPRPQRSLDEAGLRRQIGLLPPPNRPKSANGKGKESNMGVAMYPFGSTDPFPSMAQLSAYGKTGFPGDDTLLPSSYGRKAHVVPQTRELYLHPSQIFGPESLTSAELPSYFDASVNVTSSESAPAGLDSSITLPPILTLEDIVQPHVFGKMDIDESGVSTMYPSMPKSPSGLSSMESSFNTGIPPAPAYAYGSTFSSDFKPWSTLTLGGQMGSMNDNDAFSAYRPMEIDHHPFATMPRHSTLASPRLQPMQMTLGALPYSDRSSVAGQPGNSPSPSFPSSSSQVREGSPARPATRDGMLSMRSTSPQDSVPQKRSGKLPAAVTTTLKNWLLAHTQHPYPTEEEKRTLCSETGLTMNQVSNWFINARRRILPNLGNVAMSGNRKQLTHYNPPGPRRLPRQDLMGHGYPATHADAAHYYGPDSSLAAARMRGHPYPNYMAPPPPAGLHPSLTTYGYAGDMVPY